MGVIVKKLNHLVKRKGATFFPYHFENSIGENLKKMCQQYYNFYCQKIHKSHSKLRISL